MILKAASWLGAGAAVVLVLSFSLAQARDAAFLDPGTSNSGAGDDAVRVEPKGDIDTGESILNVPRRTTIFFVNQTNLPVQIEKVSVNGDGNVSAEVTNDDCSKQGTIPAQSRCSVEVAVTPTSPGAWSTEVLLTHNGAGRIARSKLTGKTTGSTASTERKDTGLALSTKEAPPVNFGDVEVGAKAVHSALMINDSPDTITIYSIDVIEAENGLQKLDQGCAVDMELKPGESCPVTLMWTPDTNGQISTDLIIRHSGRLGFAVIPIRGSAKGGVMASKDKTSAAALDASKAALPPPPPSAQDLEKASHVVAVSSDALAAPPVPSGAIRLIGTVGNRAVLLKPDGDTAIVNVGEEFDVGDRQAKLLLLGAKSASVLLDGKKKDLVLAAAPELTTKARNKDSGDTASAANGQNSGSTSGSNSGSSSTGGLGSPLNNAPSGPPSLVPMLPPTSASAK